jgi:trk system potassium uptake protein TrkA
VVGRCVDELPLPEGVTVGVIVRGDKLVFPHRDTVIEPEDHVVLFLADRRKINDVERMFQVSIAFF